MGLTSLFMVVLLTACSDPMVESQELLVSAKDYLAKNSLRKAVLELKKSLQQNPQNSEARYLLGQLDLEFGDVEGAQKEFRRAGKSGWDGGQVQLGLARALVSGGKFQKMLDEIKVDATYSASIRANLYALRAISFAGLNRSKQAGDALKTATQTDPDAIEVQKADVKLKLQQGDIKTAKQQLTKALNLYPENRELLLLNALVAMREKRLADASKTLEKVIAQDPGNITTRYGRRARLQLAQIQLSGKQLDTAEKTLRPLIKRFPNDPETNYLAGNLAFQQGKPDLAGERLLKVLKVAPDHVQTQLLYGVVSFQQKHFEQAADYLARYLRVVPGNIGARKLLGRTYMLLNQSGKAQAVLKPALKEGKDDVELLALVGANQLHSGEIAEGIENLQKAVKHAPGNNALHRQLAKAYISSGETEQAIKELNRLLVKKGDKQNNTRVLLVIAYLKAGETQKAIDTATRIIEENPGNPAALTLVGNVYAAVGKNEQARKYLTQALQAKAGYLQANLSLARLDEAEGKIEDAKAIYKQVADTNTQTSIPLLALARLAQKRGDKDAMYSWLERARTQAPGELRPRLILAEAYLRDRELEKAQLVIKEAQEIAPNDVLVLADLSRVLVAQKRYNDALPKLRAWVAADQKSVLARLLLAQTYLQLGQLDDAAKSVQAALDNQPESIPALALMGRIDLVKGEYVEAEKIARKLQSLKPKQAVGYQLAGDAWLGRKAFAEAGKSYLEAWKYRQASDLAIKISVATTRTNHPETGIDVLKDWLKNHPDDVRAWQFLGIAYQTSGNVSEAKAAYQKLLELEPENIVGLNNLAGIYTKEGDSRALGLAEKAYNLQPDNPGIKDTYGWAQIQQGDVRKGRRLIEQALEKMSKVAEVRYHHAVALIQTGDKQEGMKSLRALVAEEKDFPGLEDAKRLLSE